MSKNEKVMTTNENAATTQKVTIESGSKLAIKNLAGNFTIKPTFLIWMDRVKEAS